ncbi:hypothetical protein U3A58_17965 [Algoriphagus sp. C2-6-M1]|uniref:hypothetical protein n=1 Tax=Algoriphagus persicinus TaxID=3108754 RepID=UPI002B36503F|nr:hypothetical protein [Algoriphagus sp. C2-6-M1]MEB2782282.1 hypothetical protein [Algoriphagus sp. C2-6-M1]
MSNQSKEDEYIRKFIVELGTEEPPVGFHKSILASLNHAPSATDYKPVISALAWKIIAGAIAGLCITVLIFVPNGSDATPLFDQLSGITIPEVVIPFPRVSLPVINLPHIVIESLVAFILLALGTVITSFHKWRMS